MPSENRILSVIIKELCFAYKRLSNKRPLMSPVHVVAYLKSEDCLFKKGGIKVMKNMKRRIISGLMAIAMIIGAVEESMITAYAYMPGSGNQGQENTGQNASGGGAASLFDLVSDDGQINSGSEVARQNTDGSFTTIITKYKSIAVAIMGILTITMLIFMLIQFTKLGAAGDNEIARKKAIMGILTTGIATALLGGATIIVGFFWGALIGS